MARLAVNRLSLRQHFANFFFHSTSCQTRASRSCCDVARDPGGEHSRRGTEPEHVSRCFDALSVGFSQDSTSAQGDHLWRLTRDRLNHIRFDIAEPRFTLLGKYVCNRLRRFGFDQIVGINPRAIQQRRKLQGRRCLAATAIPTQENRSLKRNRVVVVHSEYGIANGTSRQLISKTRC